MGYALLAKHCVLHSRLTKMIYANTLHRIMHSYVERITQIALIRQNWADVG